MKIITRIATAITAAFVSLFVAAPAFAAGGHGGEKYDPAAQFSAAGQPVDTAAILITGAILLVIVLLTSQLVSGLFAKSGE